MDLEEDFHEPIHQHLPTDEFEQQRTFSSWLEKLEDAVGRGKLNLWNWIYEILK